MSDVIWFNSHIKEWSWLSNFHPAPVQAKGVIWPSNEHLYQAMKTLDPAWRMRIRMAISTKQAKKFGYDVPLRPEWDTIWLDVMRCITRLKYSQHPDLKQRLKLTGDAELIHWAPWGDDFWGVNASGKGLNVQGLVLMEYRDSLSNQPLPLPQPSSI